MSTELECGSDTLGRYTCKYAPQPSVCCANGCCAIPSSGEQTHRPLQLWARIVVAVGVGAAMVLCFLVLKYRDRRGSRAYARMREHRRAQAAAQQQQQPAREVDDGAPPEDGEHEPTGPTRE